MFLRIVLIFLLISNTVVAKHLHPEKYYQDYWCSNNHGKSEVKLIDNTRIDCLTETHAIEFDFASKWAEAVGQSLHYARLSGKNPAIVLIIESSDDYKHYNKLKPICDRYDIALWQMTPPNKNAKRNFATLDEMFQSIFETLINEICSLFGRVVKKLLY